jgi:hypothetical protein
MSSMAPANAAPADAGQAQHAGHDMSGMADMPQHPASDCCDERSMDCPCGCIVSQPGVAHLVATGQAHAGALESTVVASSHHPSNPATSPFRPPA